MRGEIAVGVGVALVALLVCSLVPFAMNLSAHFLYRVTAPPVRSTVEARKGLRTRIEVVFLFRKQR